jgi:serine/threonine protein kinase
MAPEIFDMQEYDAKADVWSVGCIFYEMLVGGPPFRGSNPRELFQNIRTKSLQVPPEVSLGRDSLEILQRVSRVQLQCGTDIPWMMTLFAL